MSLQNTAVSEDWSTCEVRETEASPVLNPEGDAELLVAAAPEAKDQAIAVYKQKAAALVPTDDLTVKSCGIFVDQCKAAAKRVEEEREKLVGPLNATVKRYNAERIPVREMFLEMAKVVTERVNRFLESRRIAAELEQKRINDEIAAKQRELDRQAEELRAAAAAAETPKEAAKLEAKADKIEMKAAELVPAMVEQPSNKIDLAESTVSFAGPKMTWSLPGWDKKDKIRVVFNGEADRRISALIGDLKALPDGVVFLLTHCDLNPVYLNKSFGALKFPHPFAETKDYSGSRRT